MTHDLCYLLLFIIGTDIKFNYTNLAIHFRDTRAALSLPQVITRLRSEDPVSPARCRFQQSARHRLAEKLSEDRYFILYTFWQLFPHMSNSAGSRMPYIVFIVAEVIDP